MRRLGSGFSLLELLVAIALAGLIVLMGLLQTSRATEAAQTRGLAEVVAEELRAARRQAVAEQHPVAVVFPSANGGSAHNQGLYIVEGTDKPKVTRGRQFHGDFPEAFAFVGVWPIAGFTNSRAAMPLLGNVTDFDLQAWQVPFPRDYHFVFTPSGQVVTNGLVHYDNRYHILVSQGVAYAPGARPAGGSPFNISYFQPSRVATPYTIAVTAGGEVEVTPGVPASSLGGSGRVETANPPTLPLPTTSNSPPILVKVTSDPLPPDLPNGVDAVIPPNGYLTLELSVKEPDGQVPYCSWTTSGGTLSSPVPTAMEWNREEEMWEGSWVWSPPDGSLPDDDFTLRYKVDDGHGGVITGKLGATGKVRVGQTGLIALGTYTTSGAEVRTVSPDGAEKSLLTPEHDRIDCAFPAWQPGGNQLVCHGATVTESEDGPSGLYVVNRDGSGLTVVDSAADGSLFSGHVGFPCAPAAWSPDGTRIAYSRSSGAGCCIFVVNADGSDKMRLTSPTASRMDMHPSWSPDGDTIVFERIRLNSEDEYEEGRIATVPAAGGGSVNILISEPDSLLSFPQFTPNGASLVYLVDWTEVRVADADGSNPIKISNHTTPNFFTTRPVLSPDGTMVAYSSYGLPLLIVTGDIFVTTIDGRDPDTSATGAKSIMSVSYDFMANPFEGFLFPQEPTWSPDSKRLAYREGSTLCQTNVLGTLEPRVILEGTMVGGWNTPSWTR